MELLIVIVILGILVTLGGASFRGSQKKGRDARRKADLHNISLALEQYYSDKGEYPEDGGDSGNVYACDPDGTSLCAWGAAFAQIVNGKNVVYMLTLPDDPVVAQQYYYDAGNQNKSYQLYAHLENSEDMEIITPSNGSATCGTGTPCNYGVASSATTP